MLRWWNGEKRLKSHIESAQAKNPSWQSQSTEQPEHHSHFEHEEDAFTLFYRRIGPLTTTRLALAVPDFHRRPFAGVHGAGPLGWVK